MNLAKSVIVCWVTLLPVSTASLPPKPSPWILNNALPGITFHEPLDLQFLPQRPQVFFVLERGGKLFSVTPPSQKDLVLDISARFDTKLLQ